MTQLVTVVIPAYNAGPTLDETLHSVRGQTHTNLDIIVVDDGATDNTAEIAAAHAASDSRIRLIRQPNSGVAAARNTGWRAAHSEYIALIDSDDLWAPATIEKLLAALLAGGPRTGVAYCFFTKIDRHSMAPDNFTPPQPVSGEALDAILLHNFAGCGSTMLTRREVLESTDGFDESLHLAGAQGCDDYLFCCRAAEHYLYACVPEVLVGYRDTPGGISSKVRKMLRSWMLVSEQMLTRRPEKRAFIEQGLRTYAEWLLGLAVTAAKFRQSRDILVLLWRHHPSIAAAVTREYLPQLAIFLARRAKRRLTRKLRGRITPPTPRHRFPAAHP